MRVSGANDDRPFPLGGPERARYGAIVSFENSVGETLVLHRKGPVRQALLEACEAAQGLDETFLVVCISTPESVYTDLQGSRPDTMGRFGYPLLPERMNLPGDLTRLLHPRLLV